MDLDSQCKRYEQNNSAQPINQKYVTVHRKIFQNRSEAEIFTVKPAPHEMNNTIEFISFGAIMHFL